MTNPKRHIDEELCDMIFTHVDRKLAPGEIYDKLQNEGAITGKRVNKEKIIQSVQRRKRQMRTLTSKDLISLSKRTKFNEKPAK